MRNAKFSLEYLTWKIFIIGVFLSVSVKKYKDYVTVNELKKLN